MANEYEANSKDLRCNIKVSLDEELIGRNVVLKTAKEKILV